ncbi:MAG TPA: hypothetical protein VF427_15830 [Noviherbaspirillum sp.]
MSRNGRFRYPLEPVLLTRQWDLDALLLELNQANEALSKLRNECAAVQDKIDSCTGEWKNRADTALTVDSFAVLTNYLQDLAKQRLRVEQEIAQQEQERDALIERVVAARRGVDAVEQHRDEMKAEFVRQRLSQDFKLADDHWSTLQTRMEKHDSQS